MTVGCLDAVLHQFRLHSKRKSAMFEQRVEELLFCYKSVWSNQLCILYLYLSIWPEHIHILFRRVHDLIFERAILWSHFWSHCDTVHFIEEAFVAFVQSLLSLLGLAACGASLLFLVIGQEATRPSCAYNEDMLSMNRWAAPAVDQDSSRLPTEILKSLPTMEKRIIFRQTGESSPNEYGRSHYRRRCRIRAPCCREVYDCRHCRNEAKSRDKLTTEGWEDARSCEKRSKKCHDLPLQAVESVICSMCSTEQEVHQVYVNCGVKMGEYFCSKCRFFDDDTSKGQFHCDDCGICRTGGRDKFFHCQRCGCCLNVRLQKGHLCVEKTMHQNCPICIEYLFDSRKQIEVLKCGHTLHLACFEQMKNHSQFFYPICSKSTSDVTIVWEQMDEEIAATPMPEGYRNQMVWIL